MTHRRLFPFKDVCGCIISVSLANKSFFSYMRPVYSLIFYGRLEFKSIYMYGRYFEIVQDQKIYL